MSVSRKFKTLDVRSILVRGDEPFTQIRASLDRLAAGEGLSVVAPFLPSPLAERLGTEGFRSRVERQPGGCWITHFWKD
jgi:uncharacterized protein (DUF2249 family)